MTLPRHGLLAAVIAPLTVAALVVAPASAHEQKEPNADAKHPKCGAGYVLVQQKPITVKLKGKKVTVGYGAEYRKTIDQYQFSVCSFTVHAGPTWGKPSRTFVNLEYRGGDTWVNRTRKYSAGPVVQAGDVRDADDYNKSTCVGGTSKVVYQDKTGTVSLKSICK
jgi:hypothetical protein